MVDIRNGRIPESSRRFDRKLGYHGMARQVWKDLEVQLLLDDGIYVGRGVCRKFEPTDSVADEVLGDSHVGVQVLDVVEDLNPLHWKDSMCRWKIINVLHDGVSLFERLRQREYRNPPGFYCEDTELDVSSIHPAHGMLKDQQLTSVAPWLNSCKGNEGLDGLPAECSKICQDAFHEIENSSKIEKASLVSDFRERYCNGLLFPEKLRKDEDTRFDQILDCLSNGATKNAVMEHLGTANGFCLAGDVVKRLKTLHNLNEPGTDSALINTMIKATEEMELNTLCSIREHVQLEKQRESVLEGMRIILMETILKLREEQHQSLMEMLAKTEASQISELEEFVTNKFKLVNDVYRTKKETESVVGWLSKISAKATDQIKRTRMMEKKQWEVQMAKSEEEAAKSKAELEAELEAARREAEELATNSKKMGGKNCKVGRASGKIKS